MECFCRIFMSAAKACRRHTIEETLFRKEVVSGLVLQILESYFSTVLRKICKIKLGVQVLDLQIFEWVRLSMSLMFELSWNHLRSRHCLRQRRFQGHEIWNRSIPLRPYYWWPMFAVLFSSENREHLWVSEIFECGANLKCGSLRVITRHLPVLLPGKLTEVSLSLKAVQLDS